LASSTRTTEVEAWRRGVERAAVVLEPHIGSTARHRGTDPRH